jgi:hypothetical protein
MCTLSLSPNIITATFGFFLFVFFVGFYFIHSTMHRLSSDTIVEIASYLQSTARAVAVCRRFRAALRTHRAVVVAITHGRIRHGRQLAWLWEHADGVARLKLRYGVHQTAHHDGELWIALARHAHVRALDLALGASALRLSHLAHLLERRLPVLEELRVDLAFRADGDRLDARFWTALHRLRELRLVADKPEDVTDADLVALLESTAGAAAAVRWRSLDLSIRSANVTERGVRALAAALQRCPSLTSVRLDVSFIDVAADRDRVMAHLAAVGRLPGLRRFAVVADDDDGIAEMPAPVVAPFDPTVPLGANIRRLSLSLANHWVDLRAAAFPPRLEHLTLDLFGARGVDTAGWAGLAAALAATAGTLAGLNLYLGSCDVDDAALGRLMHDGVRPLGRLRGVRLDLSNNPMVSHVAWAATALPPALRTLFLNVSDLRSLRAIPLGHLSRCHRLILRAAHNRLVSLVLPPGVESLVMVLTQSWLQERCVLPTTLRRLSLGLESTVLVSHPPRAGGGGGRPVQLPLDACRFLEVDATHAHRSTHEWLAVVSALTPAVTALRWNAQCGGAHGLVPALARLSPRVDTVSLEIGRDALDNDAVLEALGHTFTAASPVRYVVLHIRHGTTGAPPCWVQSRRTDALAGIFAGLRRRTPHLSVILDCFVPAALLAALCAATVERATQPHYTTTVMLYMHTFLQTSPVIRADIERMTALPGVCLLFRSAVGQPPSPSVSDIERCVGNLLFTEFTAAYDRSHA